jgi:hypothetical protein
MIHNNRRVRTVPRSTGGPWPALVPAPRSPEPEPGATPEPAWPAEPAAPAAAPAAPGAGPAAAPAAPGARPTGTPDAAASDAAAADVAGTAGRLGGPVASRQPVVLSSDGLPRRIRQASLAPQLREASSPPPEPAPEAPLGRSPEQIRAMMSALQSGTRRGRVDGSGPDAPPRQPTEARAVPFRLSGPVGPAAASIDVPFTGPLGPAGHPAAPEVMVPDPLAWDAVEQAPSEEDWFHPFRVAEPPAAPGPPAQRNDPEEDA